MLTPQSMADVRRMATVIEQLKPELGPVALRAESISNPLDF